MDQGLVGRAPGAAEISATEAQLAAGVSLQIIGTADGGLPETVAQFDAIYRSVCLDARPTHPDLRPGYATIRLSR